MENLDKNNWCINLKETPEGELKELFKKWFLKQKNRYKIKFRYRFDDFYYGLDEGFPKCFIPEQKNNLITIEQWYNEIYLNGQPAKRISELPKELKLMDLNPELVEVNPVCRASDLKQLEERIMNFVNDKLTRFAGDLELDADKRLTVLEGLFSEGISKIIEERLTKLIDEKFEQPYIPKDSVVKMQIMDGDELKTIQEIPPFPFWVEITKGDGWYKDEVGNKFEVKGWSRSDGNLPNHYALQDVFELLIAPSDCKILHDYKPEEKKPIWETHPDWESCRTERQRFWHTLSGGLVSDKGIALVSTSEVHAKRQVAEIKLMEISEPWNKSVERKGTEMWVPIKKNGELIASLFHQDFIGASLIPFFFHSYELCIKSIELHPDLWNDYYMINKKF